MYRNFDEIIEAAVMQAEKRTACIAGADDERMLEVAREVMSRGLCRLILVGNKAGICAKAGRAGIELAKTVILDETDPDRIGMTAVRQVRAGIADILVKGKLNTSDFLHAVLNREWGLRTGAKLSVLTSYDVPGQKKLFFLTDGGMVVAPSLEDKASILRNAVTVLHNMGITEPRVAILAANEKITESMPATVDAGKLCAMAEEGLLPKAVYEGPVAFDVAMRPEAADQKKISSRVSGNVDLFLVPNVETGNCLGKAIGYFGGGQTAGIVIGAACPVVMSSRAASVQGKLASIAWALIAGSGRKEDTNE